MSGSHLLLTRTASRFVPVADKLVGDFETERAETTAMFAKPFAIQINVGDQARRFEPQEISFAGFRHEVQLAPIPARPTIIILSLLRLFPAPVVWNGNRLPVAVVEVRLLRVGDFARLKFPARIQQRAFAGERIEGRTNIKMKMQYLRMNHNMPEIIPAANAMSNPAAGCPPVLFPATAAQFNQPLASRAHA